MPRLAAPGLPTRQTSWSSEASLGKGKFKKMDSAAATGDDFWSIYRIVSLSKGESRELVLRSTWTLKSRLFSIFAREPR